jgi:hypothetical protein
MGRLGDDDVAGLGWMTALWARGQHRSIASWAWERHWVHNIAGSGTVLWAWGQCLKGSTASPPQGGEDGGE